MMWSRYKFELHDDNLSEDVRRVLMLRRGGDGRTAAASKAFQLKQTQGGWRLAQRQPQPQDQDAQDADVRFPLCFRLFIIMIRTKTK